MRVAIVRRAPNASFSMDVYADGLVSGLKAVRPSWEIVELIPNSPSSSKTNALFSGLQKYYQRYWQYPAAVKHKTADIFHLIDHSDGHIAYWLKNRDQPVVVTCHDLINFIQPENISNQARFPALSRLIWQYAVNGICSANRIITVSAHTANDVMQLLRIEQERLTVVPNAVESVFRVLAQTDVEAVRQQYQIPQGTTCLLNVGSSHPRKNIETVLRTIAALKSQNVAVHLLKAGAEFSAEQTELIQQHDLGSHLTYVGKPDKETLVQLYNAADILIAPSLYEGFGMTVLEAMACGTPVITSNVTSLPEVAGDAAIMVEPTDVTAIVEAVHRLQNDVGYRTSLRQKGLERVRLFTWEKTAEQVAQVYERLAPARTTQLPREKQSVTEASTR